jgi:hypothetical protein
MVLVGKIEPRTAQRLDQYLQKGKDTGHSSCIAPLNGIKEVVRDRRVLGVLFDVLDEGRSVKGKELSGDGGGQPAHESRS